MQNQTTNINKPLTDEEKAALHFIQLYENELTDNMKSHIYEWWKSTADQYPDDTDYEKIEELIIKSYKNSTR